MHLTHTWGMQEGRQTEFLLKEGAFDIELNLIHFIMNSNCFLLNKATSNELSLLKQHQGWGIPAVLTRLCAKPETFTKKLLNNKIEKLLRRW